MARKFDDGEELTCSDCGKPEHDSIHNEGDGDHFFYVEGRAERTSLHEARRPAPHSIEQLYGAATSRTDRVDTSERPSGRVVRPFVLPTRKRSAAKDGGEAIAPAVAPVDTVPCSRCGATKTRGHHRGRGSHTFNADSQSSLAEALSSLAAAVREMIERVTPAPRARKVAAPRRKPHAAKRARQRRGRRR